VREEEEEEERGRREARWLRLAIIAAEDVCVFE